MQVEVREIEIPFRFQYGHALKQHRGLQGILCIVRDDAGHVGVGEAVPRTYVTGETCESILAEIESLARRTQVPENGAVSISSLIDTRRQLGVKQISPFPSCALCALDLARADLLSRQQGTPLATWMGGSSNVAEPYCASVGMGRGRKGRLKLRALLRLYRHLGFRQFKLKVGDDQDEARVNWIRSILGDEAKMFVDANAAWDPETAIRKIERFASCGIWAVEEPLAFREATHKGPGGMWDRLSTLDEAHYRNYQWLRERSPLPLIADESLICMNSLQRIIESRSFDILNVRLSKCGGPWMSAAMIQAAQKNGMGYSVAAMVGESPILASAGAHFAAAMKTESAGPLYVQGYSHGLLHTRRIALKEPPLSKGSVTLNPQPGLGLQINFDTVDAVTRKQLSFTLA